MTTLLVIIQAIAATLLGVVGVLPYFQREGGGPNRAAYICLLVGALAFIVSTAIIQIINDAETKKSQRRIEELLDRLFNQVAPRVMSTPAGPEHPPAQAALDFIRIQAPDNSSRVKHRAFVEGVVSDQKAEVWVVVHPTDTSSYWVQPKISVRSGGEWSVLAYFGRAGSIDSTKKFEVIAIVNPIEKLREGDYFDAWPQAKWASQVITVERE